MPYAQVAVDMSTRQKVKLLAPSPRQDWDADLPWTRTFHYGIPPALHTRVAVGQLVWVPFGRQKVQGVIVGFDDVAPVAQLREIARLVDDKPALTPAQISLARWMSLYYLTPLFDTLSLMLPLGLAREAKTVVFLAQAPPSSANLSAEERFTLSALAEVGAMPVAQAEERFGAKMIRMLTQQGWLLQRDEMPQPRVTPKRAKFARLLVHGDVLTAQQVTLGRDNDQATALVWLSAQPGRAATVAALQRATGISASTIKRMERKGWVEVTRQSGSAQHPELLATARLLLAATELTATIVWLRGATKHVAVLKLLEEQGEPISLTALRRETGVTSAVLDELAARQLIAIEEQDVWRTPLVGREFVLTSTPTFTRAQQEVWDRLSPAWEAPGSQTFLLHGVTGSGKTEIYLRAVLETLKRGKQAIVLVPEISLTPQTIRRFAARFPGRLAVIHSQLSSGERYDEWRRIRDGMADVVVGPRSALFAPLSRLGLIVLDEEHDGSYKQEPIPGQQLPSYDARDVAIKLAEITGAKVILGSATPSLTSYYRAQQGEYTLLRLPRRIMGHREHWEAQSARLGVKEVRYRPLSEAADDARYMEMPPVEVVDLRQELRSGNRSILSRSLQKGIAQTLAAKQQVILFLNRRGMATFVMCRDCGYVAKCPACDIPLTYHAAGEKLLCHRCGYQRLSPDICPNCGGRHIRYFGIGTQRVEAVTREMFPQARILRWDSDVIAGGTTHEAILEQFSRHEADILIGTQIIAKGLDLPLVTLVGVVTADTALNLPDFVSAERTFQLLAQVAGRAGRSILGGRVIIQTYTPEHYAIQAASRHDYDAFYEREMLFRREQWYPPFSRLIKLIYADEREDRAERESARLVELLREKKETMALPQLDVLGPSPSFFSPWQGRYRWQVLLRGIEPAALLRTIPLPPGWQADIDPISAL